MAIMVPSPALLDFTVRRCELELVVPTKPTPHEFKLLSDLDDQEFLRFQIRVIQLYRCDPSMHRKDPVKVIREALAQALVFYYPFAGRLREGPGRKLILECTAEGVMFIEADADVALEQFGDALHPPFPCVDKLLYDVPGSGEILNCPLLLIQVTRLRCGGFIFALRLNHTMSDAIGIAQFMGAVGEMAQGKCAPSIPPVWHRELLNARNPPRVTCTHYLFDEVPDTNDYPLHNMVPCSFFFGSTQVNAIRKHVPSHLRQCSTFEIITACIWRCSTTALNPDIESQVRVIFPVNVRAKLSPPLPTGYYGNAIVFVVAITTAGKLCQNPFGYALELVKTAKNNVTVEYVWSYTDLAVIKDKRDFNRVRCYFPTDVTCVGFEEVDFGWGKAVYGGPAKLWNEPNSKLTGHNTSFGNGSGKNVIVSILLPNEAREIFMKELDGMLKGHAIGGPSSISY
uniref:Uncharacterized protein n=1 Tax=Fagus sylvatica TaxID=28930 RepID=A0A2N9GBJ9_FAGSY